MRKSSSFGFSELMKYRQRKPVFGVRVNRDVDRSRNRCIPTENAQDACPPSRRLITETAGDEATGKLPGSPRKPRRPELPLAAWILR